MITPRPYWLSNNRQGFIPHSLIFLIILHIYSYNHRLFKWILVKLSFLSHTFCFRQESFAFPYMLYCNTCVRMGTKESKVSHICTCNKGKFTAHHKSKKAIKSKTNKKFNNITIIYFRAPSLEQKNCLQAQYICIYHRWIKKHSHNMKKWQTMVYHNVFFKNSM